MTYISLIISVSAFIGLLIILTMIRNRKLSSIKRHIKRTYAKLNIFSYTYDVSGKRNPEIEKYVNMYLEANFKEIQKFKKCYIKCLRDILKYCNDQYEKNKSKRVRKYLTATTTKIIDLSNNFDTLKIFRFKLERYQTRYKQVNYQRTPYKVPVTHSEEMFSFYELNEIYNKLQSRDTSITLEEHVKRERGRMTADLKAKIMERDNYTCQICGKYMPDKVGLQIDHIVPVSKFGTSEESNLQVLCSICNGKKSNK